MILDDTPLAKAAQDDKKRNLFANSNTTPPEYDFKKCGACAFMGNFLCVVERVKRFVKVHLHCIVRNLKNDSEMPTLPLPRKISADAHAYRQYCTFP